jgi:hypothetical protein
MIDRNEWDRNRDREQEFDRERGGHRLDYGRNRELRGYETSRWENEGGRYEGEREGRENFPRYEDRFRDYPDDYRRERGEWRGGSHNADFGHRGDWGRQSSWGTYGNRPSYDREDERNLRSTPYRGRYERQYGGGVGSYYGGFGGFSEEGRYAGRGPKNWQRSDERIKEDVNERLTDHPPIDATEIDIQVRNAEVTNSGSVEDRRIKRMVEDLVEGVSGVKEVHNQLRAQAGSHYQGAEMATFAGSQTTATQTRKQ